LSDAQYQGQQLVYLLDYKIPGANAERIPVIEKLTVGSADDVDVAVDDFGLAPHHAIFRVHNDVLSIHNLGGSDNSFIGKQALVHGRMYIIDAGDKISLGELEFIIRTEEVDNTKSFENAIGIETHDLSVADILNKSTEEDLNSKEDNKENIFSKLVNKIKSIFKKKSLADDDEDMTLPSGIKKNTKTELLLRQMNKRKTMTNIGRKKFQGAFFASVNGAKPLHRILALILNLLILQSAYFIYIPHFKLQKYYQTATLELIKYIDLALVYITPSLPKDYLKYLEYLTHEKALNLIVIFFAIELGSCLVLGVNLGQFFVGISSDGSFIVKRIKASLRTIIGIITAPFLIFDIPAFMGNKTMKEFLSGSQIGHTKDSVKAFGTFISFPIFFIILVLSPIFIVPDFHKMPSIIYSTPAIEKSKNPAYKAKSFLLNTNIKAKKFTDMILVPGLNHSNGKSVSSISLVNTKSGSLATLTIQKINLSHKELAKTGLTAHYAASILYPTLTSEQNATFGNNSFLELERLMMNSFRLNPEEGLKLIQDHGPFMIGISKLRNIILKDHFIKNPQKINFIKKEKRTFISFGDDNELGILYLLNPQHPLIIKLNYQLKERKTGQKLYNLAIKSTQRINNIKRKESSFTKKLSSTKTWNAFDVLDFYSYLESIPKNIDDVLISRYLKFMHKIGKTGLQVGNKRVIKTLVKTLGSTEKTLLKLRVPKTTSLIKAINEQITALNNKDLNYFVK
jgi:hypothetical protein